MNIRKCGKTRTNADFKRRLTRTFILLSTLYSLLSTSVSAETFYAAGRGTKDNGTVWKYKGGRWSVHSVIPDCSEIFALAVDKKGDIWAGGSYFGYGTVWQYNKKGSWEKGARLPECRGLYALAVDQKGNIWAGGSGTKNIWRYDGTKWDEGAELNGCVGIYALTVDSGGNIWAGGEGKAQVWKYNGKEWDSGTKLDDCTEAFSLCIDSQGILWVGGRGGKVLWWHSAKGSALGGKDKWLPGIILLDSTEISAFTVDPLDGLCAAGAGRNKIWLKKGETDWIGADLEECIAIYAVASGKRIVLAGGWNSQRKGRVWVKKRNAWGKGADLKDCYVIRALSAGRQ